MKDINKLSNYPPFMVKTGITKTITKEQEKEFKRFVEKQKKIAEAYSTNKRLMGGLTAEAES